VYKPVRAAARFLQGIDFSALATKPWHIGLDAGECVFCALELSGYKASGPAAARARLLASLAGRYQTQILVSKTAAGHLEEAVLRSVGQTEGGGELFFELKAGE
jgi:hypothetical protein